MRRFLLSALAATSLLFAVPAQAGTAEINFLNKLAGTWSGSGTMKGAETGPVSCKLQFKPGNTRVTYTGRCNVQDLGAQSFSGSIGYNDTTNQYVASSQGQTAVGIKRGNAVTFTTKRSSLQGSSYSTMTFSATRITIAFTIITKDGTTRSTVVFNK